LRNPHQAAEVVNSNQLKTLIKAVEKQVFIRQEPPPQFTLTQTQKPPSITPSAFLAVTVKSSQEKVLIT